MNPTPLFERIDNWSRPVKVGVVVGGYVLALGLSGLLVVLFVAYGDTHPDMVASSGMTAFSQALLLLLTLGLGLLGVLLILLRKVQAFWWGCIAIAGLWWLLGFVAMLTLAVPSQADPVGWFSLVTSLRVLLAPLSALLCAAAGCFPQDHWFRHILWAGAGADGFVGVCGLALY